MYKMLVVLVASVHIVLAISLALSVAIVPFLVNYFIAIPLCVATVRILTSNDRCVLTDLEIYLRKKAKMKPITGFVGHYFIKIPKQALRAMRGKKHAVRKTRRKTKSRSKR